MQFYIAYIWDMWSEWRSTIGIFTSYEKAEEMVGIVMKTAIEEYKNSPFGVTQEASNYDGINERYDSDIQPIDVDKLHPDDLCAFL